MRRNHSLFRGKPVLVFVLLALLIIPINMVETNIVNDEYLFTRQSNTAEASSLNMIYLPDSIRIDLFLDESTAQVNGENYTMDAAPYLNESAGRTFVPLRFVSEALGAQVDWCSESRQVFIDDWETRVTLNVGAKRARINDAWVALDAPAEIVSPGRVFVPLRFVGEALGAEVHWDSTTKAITINW